VGIDVAVLLLLRAGVAADFCYHTRFQSFAPD
jgi:hypothetical protein